MTLEGPLSQPVALDRTHDVSAFDCGVAPLNDYLRKFAYLNHQNRAARTYVTARQNRVVGFYTLAAGSVRREETPQRVAQGLGRYPVPVILLARLAVDNNEKGFGLGKALLKDSLLRCAQASDIVGCRAVLTHAKDQDAKNFYSRFGFEASPVNDLYLYLLMKDIKQVLEGDAGRG
jgi:GNAT superfamily N-acetyltransferase